MRTTAIALSRRWLASRPSVAARLPDFITLMKPRGMVLAVFTALVGLTIAPTHLDPLLGLIAIVAIAVGADFGASIPFPSAARSSTRLTRSAAAIFARYSSDSQRLSSSSK